MKAPEEKYFLLGRLIAKRELIKNEETYYYPFGLTMSGISSEAAKGIAYPTNKKKYNGIEETRELGLNQYDAQLRILDPQIAIWWQVDPETENMEMWSPYVSNYDNPILYQDPLGNEPECCKGLGDALVQSLEQVASLATGALNAWGSNQVLGAGRKSASEAGFTGDNATFYKAGQTVGDGVAMITGALEVIAGASGEVASLGIATPVAVPVALHGVSVFATAGYNLFSTPLKQNTPPAGGSPFKTKSKEAPGQTASGHPTDKRGNKLGPSGKPQVNTVKHPSQKSAKDAARNEGKGAPVKHPSPQKGNSHYHPVDKNGNKKPTSTHHEYK